MLYSMEQIPNAEARLPSKHALPYRTALPSSGFKGQEILSAFWSRQRFPLPVAIQELYVRRPGEDGFELEIVKGVQAIRAALLR